MWQIHEFRFCVRKTEVVRAVADVVLTIAVKMLFGNDIFYLTN